MKADGLDIHKHSSMAINDMNDTMTDIPGALPSLAMIRNDTARGRPVQRGTTRVGVGAGVGAQRGPRHGSGPRRLLGIRHTSGRASRQGSGTGRGWGDRARPRASSAAGCGAAGRGWTPGHERTVQLGVAASRLSNRARAVGHGAVAGVGWIGAAAGGDRGREAVGAASELE